MVHLRALEPEDLEALYALENDRSNWEVGRTNAPYSRYALRDYITNNSYDIYADHQLRQVIADENDVLLGVIDLFDFDPRHLRSEVGIALLPEYRGIGYAKEALLMLVDYSKNFLHMTQLYAVVAQSNSDSIRLFKSVGFSVSGILKSWLCKENIMDDAVFLQLLLKK